MAGGNISTRGTGIVGVPRVREGMISWWRKLTLTAPGTTAETAAGLTLNAQDVVEDVLFNVRTVGGTLDFGLSSTSSGDADGFADAVSIASTGWVRPGATVTTSDGVFYSANTRGQLLSDFNAGTTSAAAGLYLEFPHFADSLSEKTLTFAVNSTAAAVVDAFVKIASIYSSDGY